MTAAERFAAADLALDTARATWSANPTDENTATLTAAKTEYATAARANSAEAKTAYVTRETVQRVQGPQRRGRKIDGDGINGERRELGNGAVRHGKGWIEY